MFLKQLNLTNFRNYSALKLIFDHRPTVLVGDNAEGKSNILEAIHILSITKSLRVETEEELIKKGQSFAKVEGFLEETELLVVINRPGEEAFFKKKVMVNGISRRTIDFIGHLPAVIFYPSDINMVTGAPSLRRWHLDLGLAQIDLKYKKALSLYEQFLQVRNKVLKKIREGFAKTDELIFWTEGLLKQSEIISAKRKSFFEFLNPAVAGPLGKFRFEYKPSDISAVRLIETQSREIAVAATLIGPHRDDFAFLLEDRNLAHYGSRGEQRTATLAFKLAQLEYMAKILGKRPILLLDDVFSELDAIHRAYVVEIVNKQQTVIATVELENIPQDFLNSARILKVGEGKIAF